ncbi:MAG: hypothetical protein V2A69_08865 [Pseudomonadota bacterium]
MEVGDKITFSFGKTEKEGIVYKVFPKTLYIKADFKNHQGKIIVRKLAQLTKRKEKKKK